MPVTANRWWTIVGSALSIACRPPATVSSPPTPAAEPALVVTEIDERGSKHQDCRCVRAFVDINSWVQITPQLGNLVPTGSPDTPELAAARSALRALADSLREVTELLQPLAHDLPVIVQRITAAAQALDRNPADSQAGAELASAIRAHGTLLLPVTKYLNKIDRPGLIRALAQPDPGYQAVAALLRTHIERLEQALATATADYQRASGGRGLRVQLWAIHYSARRAAAQIHVEGYDNLPAGDPNPVPKLGFARTPAEQADLNNGMDAARQVADIIPRFTDITTNAARSLDSLFRSARDAARGFGGFLDSFPARATLMAFADTVQQQVPALARRLRGVADSLALVIDSLRNQQATILRGLQGSTDPAMAVDVLTRGLTQGEDAVRRFAAIGPQGLAIAMQIIDSAARATQQRLNAELLGFINAFSRDSISRWKAAIPSLHNIDRHYQELRKRVEPFVKVLQLTGVARIVGGTESVDPTGLVTRTAEDLGPGMLDLTRIEPLDGDVVLLTLRVSDGSASRVLAEPTSALRIRSYGLHRRWSGGLAFTRESRTDGILPGVSASWIIHYRSFAKMQPDGSQRDGKTWPLDFGVGLTSVVITRNSEVQLGFGPVISLFDDALVVGAGYNLQRQRGYLMLSTPLLDLVNRLSGPGETR